VLLKKARPDVEIDIYERNARGDTFGWGVVFSDDTLSGFADADPTSHEAITRAFAHWEAIDIHFRGRLFRSRGHGFSGISRKHLLEILEDRALELGVRIHHKSEIGDLGAFADHDLVVACDGLRSIVRAAYEDVFKPSLDPRTCKYMWLGTRARFDSFQFFFEENEHGMFQVHGYRFDDDTSTFIAECDEESFRAAGLDRASQEESIAYLENLFGKYLGGEHLLPNRSMWINFTTVRNERWWHAPETLDGKPFRPHLVLMGDAAHTAHFSIGSGTKLAMEDAISLAGALVKHRDLRGALSAYEEERKDLVARTQKAAQDSLAFFENVKRYAKRDPETFAFALLTRSKKIGYDNLRLRDPEFVAGENAHYAEAITQWPGGAKNTDAPPMFTPFRMRDLWLENRVVLSPMCMYSAEDGTPNDFHLVHLGSRSLGGAGLILTEMTDVSRDGRISPGCTGMYKPEHVEAWRRITNFVHTQSRAPIGLQLGHAGRKASTRYLWEGSDEPLLEGNWPVMAPSPIPYAPKNQVPREMTRDDMGRVRDEFVRATKMADEAEFDLIELHMAHGYLLATFLSPLANKRTDAYGGSAEARMRFPLEVFEAARAAWPKAKPMSVRISATDWIAGGFDVEDAVLFARALKERGCDIIDVSAGQTTPDSHPAFYGRMWQTPLSDQIRTDAAIPTMTVGNITSADQINTILLAGRADLCVLARSHLRDPYFTLRAAEEQNWDVPWPKQYKSAKPLRRPGGV
jgi:anthraniloyl-CoA monooxygenase